MRYVCVENDQVVSMLNYVPQVPDHVQVYEIDHVSYSLIMNNTHYFDTQTRSVQPVPESHVQHTLMQAQNAAHRKFLQDTDWQVLRHIRQIHLGIPTSLTESEFTALEQARHAASQQIS
jgi:hypothetical protein